MESRVPLSELDISVGDAEDAGLEVGPDWRERPSVALDAAARWFAHRQQVTEDHEQAWAAHLAESRHWQEGRSAAAREAVAEARAKVRGGSPGQQLVAGREAGTAAAANFERTVPRPIWPPNRRPSVGLEYIAADEAPGAVRRAARALRGRLGVEAGVPS